MHSPETWTHEADLTDFWASHTDPEREHGEVAEGLFDVSFEASEYPTAGGHGSINWRPCTEVDRCHLIGLRVTDLDTTYIVGRAAALNMFGGPAVSKLERDMADELAD